MSIFEYDEEKHMRSERKEWREIGHEEGLVEGENRALQLNLIGEKRKGVKRGKLCTDSED